MTPTARTIGRRDGGFAMVALLIGMSVAAIVMTAALPAWRQQVQRNKEEDLIFRGEQYARAIYLFQQKNRGANPPSIDVLVSQHFLRKKWKDPITGKDFIPVGAGIALPGGSSLPGGGVPGGGQPGGTPGGGRPGGQPAAQTPGRAGQSAPGPGQSGGGQPFQTSGQQPGITGVRSESNATSIKIYQGQQVHSYWAFDAQLMAARMGRLNQQQGQQPGRQQGQPGGQPGQGGPGARPGGPAGPGGTPVRPGGGGPPVPPGPPRSATGGSF
jgi:type II secretory pathway pseudopilin PulG